MAIYRGPIPSLQSVQQKDAFQGKLDERVCRRMQVFEMFYDFLVDNEAQQGASLKTLNGLLASADNATLFLLNGDVSYARSVLLKAEKHMQLRVCIYPRPSVLAPFCGITQGDWCTVILVLWEYGGS